MWIEQRENAALNLSGRRGSRVDGMVGSSLRAHTHSRIIATNRVVRYVKAGRMVKVNGVM